MSNDENKTGVVSDFNRELGGNTVLALRFFDEGCFAFKNGNSIDDCPYLRNSEASNAWRFGWGLEDSLSMS